MMSASGADLALKLTDIGSRRELISDSESLREHVGEVVVEEESCDACGGGDRDTRDGDTTSSILKTRSLSCREDREERCVLGGCFFTRTVRAVLLVSHHGLVAGDGLLCDLLDCERGGLECFCLCLRLSRVCLELLPGGLSTES